MQLFLGLTLLVSILSNVCARDHNETLPGKGHGLILDADFTEDRKIPSPSSPNYPTLTEKTPSSLQKTRLHNAVLPEPVWADRRPAEDRAHIVRGNVLPGVPGDQELHGGVAVPGGRVRRVAQAQRQPREHGPERLRGGDGRGHVHAAHHGREDVPRGDDGQRGPGRGREQEQHVHPAVSAGDHVEGEMAGQGV